MIGFVYRYSFILCPKNFHARWKAGVNVLLLLLLLGLTGFAQAASPLPDGFKLIRSSVGVQLYRKDYPNGFPDYVQVVRLDRGAEIQFLHGKINHQGVNSGVYGGLDVRLTSQSVIKYWQEILSRTSRAFCVTNGQFFYMYEYPTRLPFPLKANGKVVSGGYSKGEFSDQKFMLEIWKDHADIQPLTKVAFQNSTAPNILGGLAEDARKSPNKYVGRTFVGVADQNRDGIYETLLIFNTQAARQRDAADTLRSFGAQKVMMLDGGLSTQLVCQGKAYIQTERVIPQAIAVLDGTRRYSPPTLPKPTPMPPQHEKSQEQHQEEQIISIVDVPPLGSAETNFGESEIPSAHISDSPAIQDQGEQIHLKDILLVPVPIVLLSMALLGFIRRLWFR